MVVKVISIMQLYFEHYYSSSHRWLANKLLNQSNFRKAYIVLKKFHFFLQLVKIYFSLLMDLTNFFTNWFYCCLQTSGDANSTTSTLTLAPQVNDSGKQLSCRANNPHVPNSELETSWILNVHCESHFSVHVNELFLKTALTI